MDDYKSEALRNLSVQSPQTLDVTASPQAAQTPPPTEPSTLSPYFLHPGRATRNGVSGKAELRRLRAMVLVAADIASIIQAAIASWLTYVAIKAALSNATYEDVAATFNVTGIVSLIVVPMLALIVYYAIHDHYSRPKPFWNEERDILVGMGYAIVISMLLMYFSVEHFSRVWFVLSWCQLAVLLPLMRRLSRRSLISMGAWYRPAIVVGSPDSTQCVRETIESDYYSGVKVVGVLELDNSRQLKAPTATCRNSKDLQDIESRYGKIEIVFAPGTNQDLLEMSALADEWLPRSNDLMIAPQTTGLPLFGAEAISMFSQDTVLLSLHNNIGKTWAQLAKRTFDLVVSSSLIVMLTPVLLPVMALIALDRGPIVYRSQRVGKGGRVFHALKFRSMVKDSARVLDRHLAENPSARQHWQSHFKLDEDPRITPLGRFLRRTSLDELPQLINVLRGDMSLVGPRPILPEEQSGYGPEFSLYARTRPGITGMWQVCGRSELAQSERTRLNTWYARNWSLWIDIVILLKTVPVTLRGQGAT